MEHTQQISMFLVPWTSYSGGITERKHHALQNIWISRRLVNLSRANYYWHPKILHIYSDQILFKVVLALSSMPRILHLLLLPLYILSEPDKISFSVPSSNWSFQCNLTHINYCLLLKNKKTSQKHWWDSINNICMKFWKHCSQKARQI